MRFSRFYYLRRSDRRLLLAALATATLVTGLMMLPMGAPQDRHAPAKDSTDMAATADSLIDNDRHATYYYNVERPQTERFVFDPNTADSTQLLRLGLQPWQVRNIYKYRARGGVYRRKEDFARLYGLTVKQYRELEPYICISPDYLPASTLFSDDDRRPDSVPRQHKLAEGETADLSLLDTARLKEVPGIGSYFARRIADYGRRLGGYVSTDQLDEIDGFPQEAKKHFVVGSTDTERMNINTLSLNQLKRHPYINFYQARSIVDYRRQHGRIADLSELELLTDFDEQAIERLRPYVTY